MSQGRRIPSGLFNVIAAVVIMAMVQIPGLRTADAASAQIPGAESTPVLAYYYIWFSPESWNTAKLDIPLLGAYSSDDRDVMRQHIRWAKAVGIDGFIVSWKDSETLTRRLIQLVDVAHEESFKLTIIYQGLDFYREPLPISKISTDLELFIELFGENPVFDLYGKPLIIWSGTWRFNRTEIELVTAPLRDRLLVLGSQKSVADYAAIADLIDGNAYYWSSVNPSTHPDYPGKMQEMGETVHAYGGLWIAPAAPGFDARHLGGEREILRDDGAMLETQLNVAFSSHPDAIGLISWNEFSETSHVEPSCLYGTQSLSVLANLLGGTMPVVDMRCDEAALATALVGTYARIEEATPITAGQGTANLIFDFDSSAPEGRQNVASAIQGRLLLAPFSLLMFISLFVVVRRSLRAPPASPAADSQQGELKKGD